MSLMKTLANYTCRVSLLKKSIRTYKMNISELEKCMRSCVPPLTSSLHKGQAGRIGVIGGSLEYTGAPYFAGISALKAGADLIHIFCMITAANVIKAYSPELIVHPLLDTENATELITPWLDRIHTVVVGPGLGRNEKTMNTVSELIKICRKKSIALVIDADGLFLITQKIDFIKDYPSPGVILTPNKVEFERLYAVIKKDNVKSVDIDFDKLGDHVSILRKGATDEFYCKDATYNWQSNQGGTGRRCGGQGDILSGSMATFLHWSSMKYSNTCLAHATATFGASKLVRKCNERAFLVNHRGTVAKDMIKKIPDIFYDLYEDKDL